jgi:hypothetical protein
MAHGVAVAVAGHWTSAADVGRGRQWINALVMAMRARGPDARAGDDRDGAMDSPARPLHIAWRSTTALLVCKSPAVSSQGGASTTHGTGGTPRAEMRLDPLGAFGGAASRTFRDL